MYSFLILLILLVLLYIFSNSKEHMSGGTLTQLYANDAQDTYLKGNVNQLATGNYVLHWNQPTRVATGFGYNYGRPNRGQLYRRCMNCKNNINCRNCPYCSSPASQGNGAGGFRLGGDTNVPTNNPDAVNITDDTVYYPDSYAGSYYTEPKPDINKPYPYIPPSV